MLAISRGRKTKAERSPDSSARLPYYQIVETVDGVPTVHGEFETREEAEARRAEMIAEDPRYEDVLWIRDWTDTEPSESPQP
jgi:hypothetical protein